MKSCGNCVNCEKYTSGGKEKWACENWEHGVGMPFDVYPPNDEACSNWSDNPKNKGKPEEELREFIDHFLDDDDEWD